MRYLLIFSLVILMGCNATKMATKKAERLKSQAKEFSLEIVQSYFEGDCNKYFDFWSDTLLIMDGDGIVYKNATPKDKICKSYEKAIRTKGKTYDDYLKTYKVELLTPVELVERFKKKLPEYYYTSEYDYFFLGFELKEGLDKSKNFIWDDMFIFMVRKERGKWVFKGISG